VADRLRLARLLRGLSQQMMAGILRLDRGTIARYERGTRQPQGRYLDRIKGLIRAAQRISKQNL
jgi:transcriptional regulator with XRE-family HTH domain